MTKNVIRSSRGHSTPSLKISSKLVQLFSREPAVKETSKEINKQRNQLKTISVVTVIEIGTETAVFQQNRTEPKPRFYAFLLTVLPTEQL